MQNSFFLAVERQYPLTSTYYKAHDSFSTLIKLIFMNKHFTLRSFCILSSISAIVGVILLGTSFLINPGPPPGLQAVSPVFIVLFAFAIVYLSGATGRLVGWMTFFGASILFTVSLIEITFYFCALFKEPSVMGPVALDLIYSVQHLYFIVAAPAFFIPLGLVIISSRILPRILGILAVALGLGLAILGMSTLYIQVLPMSITALAGIQALWWLSAAIVLIIRAKQIPYPTSTNAS
jgi:hypothetical protein